MGIFSRAKRSKEITITVPKIPDYIKLDGIYEPLEKFTRTELNTLAKTWKKELLLKAKKRRELK